MSPGNNHARRGRGVSGRPSPGGGQHVVPLAQDKAAGAEQVAFRMLGIVPERHFAAAPMGSAGPRIIKVRVLQIAYCVVGCPPAMHSRLSCFQGVSLPSLFLRGANAKQPSTSAAADQSMKERKWGDALQRGSLSPHGEWRYRRPAGAPPPGSRAGNSFRGTKVITHHACTRSAHDR